MPLEVKAVARREVGNAGSRDIDAASCTAAAVRCRFWFEIEFAL